MRILQIIDSLEAGGAERMAVNYANALSNKIDFSGLVATRKEGALMNELNHQVNYLFLNRKKTVDFSALIRLRNYVKKNKVTVIHAHSTSFFMAFLLKLTLPSLSLIWHDHYGNSEFLEKRKSGILKIGLLLFNGIIVVNQKLKIWVQEKVQLKNVIYLPNFVTETNENLVKTVLQGEMGKRILCLANLREQKNHFLLLEIAAQLKMTHPDWTFHLVGKDFVDNYSDQLRKTIVDKNLENYVFLYGSREDIGNILEQTTIGILCSKSEGLPVSLLEYGLSKKPVVMSNVGEIGTVVQDKVNGLLIPSHEKDSFYFALVSLIENAQLRLDLGAALFETVKNSYSEKKVISHYLNWLKNN